jgi:Amt family ammonium transporter
MHPLGALTVGVVAGFVFVRMLTLTRNKWKIDDVLGVWPLQGAWGARGGVAAGIFGRKAPGGLGGVGFLPHLADTLLGIAIAVIGGYVVYAGVSAVVGLRMDPEEESNGADLKIHKISATPDRESGW